MTYDKHRLQVFLNIRHQRLNKLRLQEIHNIRLQTFDKLELDEDIPNSRPRHSTGLNLKIFPAADSRHSTCHGSTSTSLRNYRPKTRSNESVKTDAQMRFE